MSGNYILHTLEQLENVRPFSEPEAWKLFRLAAISEAVGWSLLITGIALKRYVFNGNNDPVAVAGQIHGTIFLIYIVAVVMLYSSLHWSRKRMLIAGLASVPPYGSLIFEQWAAFKRRGEALKNYRALSVGAIIIQNKQVLAVQARDDRYWTLPGGSVGAQETAETALRRHVFEQAGVVPSIGNLAYVLQQRRGKTEHLELFFLITNNSAFQSAKVQKAALASGLIDEIAYLTLTNNRSIRPTFLQTEAVTSKRSSSAPQFFSSAS